MLETSLDLSQFEDVDWARLAFPQPDGYDTKVLQRIAHNRWGWSLQDIPEGTPTWLNGQVPIEHDSQHGTRWNLPQMLAGNERWAQTAALAQAWPAQYNQFRGLMNGVRGWYPEGGRAGSGCTCGSMSGNPFHPDTPLDYPEHWGRVWATCSSTTGFLEGIAHELAHWKGYALGVYIEDWESLIFANVPPSKEDMLAAPVAGTLSEAEREMWRQKGLGFQPLRVEMVRPRGACFQEIWCCVHIMAFHLHIHKLLLVGEEIPNDQPTLESWESWAEYHVKRTWCGQKDLMAIAQPSPGPGEAFWQSYVNWTQGLITQAVAAYNIEDVNDFSPPVYD